MGLSVREWLAEELAPALEGSRPTGASTLPSSAIASATAGCCSGTSC